MCIIGDVINIKRAQKGDYFVVKIRAGWRNCVEGLKKNYNDVDVAVVRNKDEEVLRLLKDSVDKFIEYVDGHINKNGEVLIPIKARTQGKIPSKGDKLIADAYGLEQER